mmetsp:Transcript_15111/g.45623  ORF Transcript_15111/g.45623 Transcript_15111/m.45623 type:complete len:404 (-) Transcript_15111:794-2005(-)|eukprot:CAMPEP_0206148966 /NCGR_PEP_ID=MMETSP1473-20131121/37532_1 /ASSEMBLY_ACC=CAM_ASM_001109 /TAXON_ID=1461547 /ORGANISM="Stichococcus sp, Strain RCC1054" /LENGTH=403 /DNA_ID=CAMNT_0053546403 /DNA_START=791 /DNA_END=2002 /DNA_ORIENTATION=-
MRAHSRLAVLAALCIALTARPGVAIPAKRGDTASYLFPEGSETGFIQVGAASNVTGSLVPLPAAGGTFESIGLTRKLLFASSVVNAGDITGSAVSYLTVVDISQNTPEVVSTVKVPGLTAGSLKGCTIPDGNSSVPVAGAYINPLAARTLGGSKYRVALSVECYAGCGNARNAYVLQYNWDNSNRALTGPIGIKTRFQYGGCASGGRKGYYLRNLAYVDGRLYALMRPVAQPTNTLVGAVTSLFRLVDGRIITTGVSSAGLKKGSRSYSVCPSSNANIASATGFIISCSAGNVYDATNGFQPDTDPTKVYNALWYIRKGAAPKVISPEYRLDSNLTLAFPVTAPITNRYAPNPIYAFVQEFDGPYSGNTVNVQLQKFTRSGIKPLLIQNNVALELSPPANVVP